LLVTTLFVVASVIATIGGVAYYRSEAAEIYDDAYQQVELISSLKQRALQTWRNERMGDAAVLLSRNSQSATMIRYLRGSAEPVAEAAFTEWIQTYLSAYAEYDRVFLVDARGEIRLTVPQADAPPAAALIAGTASAIRDREPRVIDFYVDEGNGKPHLGLVAPVLDPGADNEAIGAILLRIDPAKVVYPILEIEESHSRTGETELVRREGDHVLFLNPLRFARDSALRLQAPAANSERLAAKAAAGETGLVRGVDYRDADVLGFIMPIEASPWILVTRIDIAELQGRLRSHLFVVTIGVLLLVISSGTTLGVWRHQQRLRALAQRAELAFRLKDSEERLRLALASASQGLYDLELPGGRAIVSPEYATMLGYDPHGFVETVDTWFDRIHPEDRDATRAALQAYLGGEAPSYRAEFRLALRSGGWKWVLSVGQVVARHGDGRPKRMIGTHTDITPLKWAQEGQARAVTQLRALLANSPTVVYSVHLIGDRFVPVAVSENVERVLGFTPGEILQPEFWTAHVHPADRDSAQRTAAEVAARDDLTHDYRFSRKDGRFIWLQDRVTVLRRRADGTPLEIAGAWNDVTERREAETALRQSEERLRLAVASARQGLWDYDLHTGAVQTTPEYAAMLGYDPASFTETAGAWNSRLHPDDAAASLAAFDDYLAGRRSDYAIEFRQQARDGSWVWIHSVGQVTERAADGRPRRMLGIHTDITARKQAEVAAARLSRLYLTLSRCNEAIVRATEIEGLLGQVCHATVESGGFDMAWIGMVDPATQEIRPVAAHGAQLEYLDDLSLTTIADDPRGHGPFGRAIRENAPVWFDDVELVGMRSPLMDRIRRFGWNGMAAVPLTREGHAVGALGIYSRAAGVLDEDARRLLTEMAANVSFALDAFAREARRREAEAALIEKEFQLTEAQRIAHIGSWTRLPDGSGRWSDEMFRIYGLPPGSQAPTLDALTALIHPDDRALIRRTQEAHERGEPVFGVEFRALLPDGSVRYLLERGERKVAPDGSDWSTGTVQDVTDLKLSEQRLQQSEERLRLALAAARQGHWDFNFATGTATVTPPNPDGAGFLGQVVTLDLDEFVQTFHPLDREWVGAAFRAYTAGQTEVFDQEFRLLMPDGRVRWTQSTGRAVERDAAGNARRVVGIVTDITERHGFLEALRLRDRAIESSMSAIALGDLDGVVTYVNRAFVDAWELGDARDAIGRSAVSFWESPEEITSAIHQMSTTGAPWSGELRAVSATGRHMDMLVSAAVVTDERQRPVGLVAASVDITQRKLTEAAVAASLREKEALLKEVHHRVKNNLQVISSLLRLELGRTMEGGVKAVLGEMQHRILSMALLHETLYQSGNLARVDLSTYLTRLAQQVFRSTAPPSGRIALKTLLEPAFVDLEQAVPCGLIVTELVSNSLKHAFPGNASGEVGVRLALVDGGPALRLVVADTGVGLPPDVDSRGTQSLGLVLVSDLARQLRGTLETGRGPGASFELTFTPRTAVLATGDDGGRA